MGLNGLSPWRFITSTDQIEVLAMYAIAERMNEIRAEAYKSAK